jgi:hypothetical protein
MPVRPYTFAYASILFIVGCDPGWAVRGSVVDASNHRAIAEATVINTCPKGAGVLTSPTDAMGRFEIRSIGELPLACTLEIHKPGFATKVIDLRTACGHDSTSMCSATIELTPLTATDEGAR